MRSMRVTNGDLDIGSGRRVEMVDGQEKLIQAMTLWLLEPLGAGPLTPGFGSLLQDMVGSESAAEMALEVEHEVSRVLGLYQANQIERLREDRNAGQLNLWNRGEILNEIETVEASALPSQGRVLVKAVVSSATDDPINLPITINDEGVSL